MTTLDCYDIIVFEYYNVRLVYEIIEFYVENDYKHMCKLIFHICYIVTFMLTEFI